jgi:hypothetical protein
LLWICWRACFPLTLLGGAVVRCDPWSWKCAFRIGLEPISLYWQVMHVLMLGCSTSPPCADLAWPVLPRHA